MRKYIFFILLLLSVASATAQDPYFSQYYSSPLTFNPALTGYFNSTHRLAINYRNQWANISSPYQTGAVSFDTRILQNSLSANDKWGLGIQAMYDQAGAGVYKNSYIAVSTGFNKGLDADGYQSIGIGVQAAYARHVVDFSKVSFANQFTSSGFDLSVPSGETINNRSIGYADLNIGMLYNYGDESGKNFNIGASVYHLLNPSLSFFSAQNSRLARRYTIHASASLPVNERDQFFFSSNFMQQANNNQTVVGLAYGWGIGDTDAHLYAGAWLRVKDATYPYIGLRNSNYQLGISYDITHSDLKKANGFTGSSEISFIYFFSQKDKRRSIPCFF